MPARESCQEPYQGYPAVGAVHPVIPNKILRDRMTQIAEIVDGVFDHTPQEEDLEEWNSPLVIEGMHDFEEDDDNAIDPTWRAGSEIHAEAEEIDELDEEEFAQFYNPLRYYRMFDAQTLGLSVFESNVSAAIANKARAVWQKNDLGQLRKELEQQTQRQAVNSSLTVVSNGVVPAGGTLPIVPRMTARQKLAFNVQAVPDDDTVELVFKEHDIVKRETFRRILRKPRKGQAPIEDPVIDFIPHVTFLAYRHGSDTRGIAESNRKINELMHDDPIVLHLGQLTTERSRLVRRTRRH